MAKSLDNTNNHTSTFLGFANEAYSIFEFFLNTQHMAHFIDNSSKRIIEALEGLKVPLGNIRSPQNTLNIRPRGEEGERTENIPHPALHSYLIMNSYFCK